MRVLVIGGDGYCGWATALELPAYLSNSGRNISIFNISILKRGSTVNSDGGPISVLDTATERQAASWHNKSFLTVS